MEALSPFKFLDSYNREDRDIFFGRESEVDELYAKIFQSRLLLVYGASGTGKSSIINCGLANKFLDSDWLPINIRRGSNINESLITEVDRLRLTDGAPRSNSPEELSSALNDVYLDYFKPVYLIFDQFEELFIFGQKEEWNLFISNINYILKNDSNVRFVFIIRGEYLEYLSEFEEIIPDFFDNRIRIEKITRQKALDCIEGPCKLFSIKLEDQFTENLLKKISPDKSEIELTFLQVFLDRIYQTAERKVNGVTTTYFTNQQIEELGEIGDVLADFLETQIYDTPDPELTLTILKSFVSLEGTKRRNTIEEVYHFTEIIARKVSRDRVENIIHDLVNRRILTDQDEAHQYELRHDSLALKIYEKITQQERELLDIKQFLLYSLNEYKKRGALLNEKDLAYVEHYESQLLLNKELVDFLEESRKNSKKKQKARRRLIAIIVLIVLLLITSAFGFFYSQKQKAKAEEMALLANEESNKAKDLQGQAESQRELAQASALEAQHQSELAVEERARAEAAQQEAERQRSLAVNAQYQALSEAERAELARKEAEENAHEAEVQKRIAEEQKSTAQQLYMLALARTMGIKSTQVSDREQSALIGLQAYSFNKKFNGNQYQPEIYTALFEATRNYLGEDYNAGKFHEGAVRAIVSHNDKIFSTGSDGQILEWTLSNHQLTSSPFVKTNHINHQLAISSSGNLIATTTDEGFLYVYSLKDKSLQVQSKQHEGDVTALAFLPGSETILTAGDDGNIFLWEDGESELLINLGQKINGLSVDPTGRFILVAIDNGSILSLGLDGKSMEVFKEPGIRATAVTYNHNGTTAAFGFENGKIVWWDMKDKSIIANLTGHTASISGLYFDKEGDFMISSSFDRSARVWKLDQLQEQPIVLADHGSWISSIGFSPDYRGVIIGEFDQKIRFYPLNMEEYVTELCSRVERNLTQAEWDEFVDEEIIYEETCKGIQ